MIAVRLAWDRVRARPALAVLCAASVAAAVALVTIAVGLRRGVERNLQELGRHCDIVVGPKSGALELVLSAGVGVTPPPGRVPAGLPEDLRADPRVDRAAAVNVENDVEGWRVVATMPEYPLFAGNDMIGDYFRGGDRVAIAGADAATALGWRPGDTFVTTHDRIDGGEAFEIVEIMRPSHSIVDRLIFVPLESLRHGGESRVAGETGPPVSAANAVLVRLKTPLDLLPVMRELNELKEVTAADPRAEIARVAEVLSGAERYARVGGFMVLVLASAGIVIALAARVEERRREAAVLRALGASFAFVVGVETAGAVIVAGTGAAAGLVAGVLVTASAGAGFDAGPAEMRIFLAAVGLSITAALGSTLPLYRRHVDDALRPE